ncbi:flagellar basal-body rod protein FlgF [Aliihoeflea aestuarii]|uniref:flagellar basal-body rod protein FlgF n=1 Tax=Aliihoeflea aestuarii TaxID=453840 RepID=UPI00209516A6|nr:flagellar basal-body rod protein FlgF [Aliihoeflea aestuarii]MCO6392879.1 flagellar basal-body rod protein FlgF [Aliihoeflea aestuarii]
MQPGLYVSLSSQVALERRLTTIADNVANAGTVGFRATGVKFEDLVTGMGKGSMSFVSTGETYLSTKSGGMKETGNPLDMAIKGDAWFGIQTPQGMVMTRDGRFTIQPDGMLVSIEGYPVVDAGGAELLLDPQAGPPVVASDGTIRQNGNLVGGVGLFQFTPGVDFVRYGNSGVVPPTQPQPILDDPDVGIMQGFVENSNVDPVLEMTRLIQVQRAFENMAALTRNSESSLNEAIKALGA